MDKPNKKIIHTTISPCDNERRIFNQALSASRQGFEVEIIALKTPDLPETALMESVVMSRLPIRRWRGGWLKFLTFNLRLLGKLLRTDFDILHDHDLWVLPGSAAAAVLKRRPLIYDAHELGTELEVFRRKKFSRKIWALLEWLFIGCADELVTINRHHADLFQKKYSRIPAPVVLLNFPRLGAGRPDASLPGFSAREKAALFQGVYKGGRALQQIVRAAQKLDKGKIDFFGFGEMEEELRQFARELRVEAKVVFHGKISWEKMPENARKYRAGLVLFEPDSVNYRYAAPNKFFEYVMAGTPVIASDIPTFRDFVSEFEVGLLVNPHSVEEIARAIKTLLSDEKKWIRYHQNCSQARKVWNWETQEEKLNALYAKFV